MTDTLYVCKYVTDRIATSGELIERQIALALKIPTTRAIELAAPAMARLIEGPCYLVPVPSSSGSLLQNQELCREIVRYVPGARTLNAIERTHPVESSCQRRRKGLPGLTVEAHAITRTVGPVNAWPLYFVDNVITTGNTIAACRRAMGWGRGLCYADASTRSNTGTLAKNQLSLL